MAFRFRRQITSIRLEYSSNCSFYQYFEFQLDLGDRLRCDRLGCRETAVDIRNYRVDLGGDYLANVLGLSFNNQGYNLDYIEGEIA